MILGPHALPGAYFDTLGCVELLAEIGEPMVRRLEARARGLMAHADPAPQAAGRQLLEGITHARMARMEWARFRSGSDDGTVEPPADDRDARYASPISDDSRGGPELTVQETAAVLHVSTVMVRRLCRTGQLRGRQPSGPGGLWFIEADSVTKYMAARRPVA